MTRYLDPELHELASMQAAEIERLRGEEAHTRVLLQGEKAQAKADKAELRAELGACKELTIALRAECCQLRDEVETLKGALDLLHTFLKNGNDWDELVFQYPEASSWFVEEKT